VSLFKAALTAARGITTRIRVAHLFDWMGAALDAE